MTNKPSDGDLSDEFRQLGENLKQAARAALQSDESRKLQREIKAGLAALGAGLEETAHQLATPDTRERLKADVQDLGERLRSGQVEAQLRADLLSALRRLNHELQKVAQSPSAADDADTGTARKLSSGPAQSD